MNTSVMVLITLCTTLCNIACAAKNIKDKNNKLRTPRTIDAANWMRANMNILGRRSLKQICIPGSHDAGMYQLNGGTFVAKECNILTQSLPVRAQLELGVRYFDVRPVISKGRFVTGHYSKIPGGSWQGGNGQPMEAIVNDINDFTRTHNELIIVSISHTLNTDVGNNNYRAFDQGEWERLFPLLDRTNNMFFGAGNTFLPWVTLGQFTNNGNRAAVLYVFFDQVNLGGRLGRGYYYPNNLNLFDKYSNTDKFSAMANDQLKKMNEVSRNPSVYFLLSWTLSQNGKDAALCPMKLGKSIKAIATEANNKLGTIYPQVSPAAYPNVIYVDDIRNSAAAELALTINYKLNF